MKNAYVTQWTIKSGKQRLHLSSISESLMAQILPPCRHLKQKLTEGRFSAVTESFLFAIPLMKMESYLA